MAVRTELHVGRNALNTPFLERYIEEVKAREPPAVIRRNE